MYFSSILFCCLVWTFSRFGGSDSANILFYHVASSYSHRVAIWPLVEALAARGHNVTFFQPYPPKHPNPNVTEFYPKDLGDIWSFLDESEKVRSSDGGFFNKRLQEGRFANMLDSLKFPKLGFLSCEALLSNPEMTKFIESNKFDLVVVDFLCNECAYGLAHKWGAKTMLYYSTYPVGSFFGEPLGFTGTDEFDVPAWFYAEKTLTRKTLLFVLRVVGIQLYIFFHLHKEWLYYPKLDTLLRTKLDIPNMPRVTELVAETDLVLYNSHFSESPARTLPPLFVPVSAMHAWDDINEKSALPKEMTKFIDESGDDGFIYVSFGSLADINSAPREFQEILLKTFARSKTRFLFKLAGDITKEMPPNVFTASWMPQREILASPNCKAFISHAGLLGTQEAIMHGIPMIVMPIFGEQDFNALRIAEMGRGIMLEVYGLTENDLFEAIQEILTNNKYKMTTEKILRQLKDQQNSPIDTAVYWTEYVLRHDREDLSRLKPMKWRHSYWFQVYYLDVWLFLLLSLIVTAYINFRIFRKIVSILKLLFQKSVKVKQS